MRGRVFVNVDKCVSCKRCKIQCAVTHSASGNLYEAMFEDPPPTARIRVTNVGAASVPVACRQCEGAPCMVACPSGAISRCSTNDPVIIDSETCVGCRSCVIACPYGVPEMNQLRSTIVKCDLCVDRMDAGKVPACVEACHTNALYFQSDEDAEAIIGEPAWMKPGGVTEGGDRS